MTLVNVQVSACICYMNTCVCLYSERPCKTLGEESLLILALGHNASLLLSIHRSPSILPAEGHMMTRWEVTFIVSGGGNTATKEISLYFSCISVQYFFVLLNFFISFLCVLGCVVCTFWFLHESLSLCLYKIVFFKPSNQAVLFSHGSTLDRMDWILDCRPCVYINKPSQTFILVRGNIIGITPHWLISVNVINIH